MEDAGEKKREIVVDIENKIDSFAGKLKAEKQKAIEERLFDFANFMEAKIALLYVTRGKEVSTTEILKKSLESGKIVVLPLFDKENNKTTLYKIDSLENDLKPGAHKIPEPDPSRCKAVPIEQIDIAIIPGIAFDEKGGRIGVGDNFYDKFVTKLPMTTRKVAIAFEEQVVPQVPADSRNKHIDIIVTDKRTIYKI